MIARRWLVAASCITLLLTACGGPKSKQDIAEELSEAVTLINYMDRPGHGTGFFVQGSKDVCTVVTARHVVAPSNQLQLQTVDGKLWQTSNIESFPNHDLAVVTFAPEGETCPYRALQLGDSDQVKEGDTIYLRGFPREHVSRGVSLFSNGTVSGILKSRILAGYGLFYQATTADGMSGGPVVNVDGKVIGVHGRTDTEIIRIANSPQSNLSPEEKALVARIDNFKWGVPINIYLENRPVHPPALVESPVKLPKEWLLGGTVGVGLLLIMGWLSSGSSRKTSNRTTLQRREAQQSPAAATPAKTVTLSQSESEDASTWFDRGNDLYNSQRYEEAIASYDKAIEIKPDFHEAWNNRGVALNELQRYSEAIASYEKAIEIKPDDHEAWNNRGNALNELQRYSEAIASYDKAIEIKPDYSYAWFGRGSALDKLQRYSEAIASCDKAIEIKPDYSYAWNNRGVALNELQRYSEAIASYDKAIEIKPDYSYAWFGRGSALGLLQRYEEAIASYDKAIEIKPDDHEAWNNRGVALNELQRYRKAIASYDKAIGIKPDFALAFYNKACCYALQSKIELAIENLQQAIEFDRARYHQMAKTDSDFDNIRHDKRFQALMER